ncbi:MAG: hypothetical protein WD512_13565 [Candidatus Paceibacterota bacterium]
MKPIPVKAAKEIANKYDYDQVIIVARKVGEAHETHGEHVTTYGKDKIHCDVAARIGSFLKYKVMGWVEETKHE